VRDAGAGLDDGAGCFMAEHHRRVDAERADPAVHVVMHVAAAHADRMHLDPDVAGADLLRQVYIAQRELARAFEYECFQRVLLIFP